MNTTETFSTLESEFRATVAAYEAAKTLHDKAKVLYDFAQYANSEAVVKHSPTWVDAHAKAGQSLPSEERVFDGFALNTLVEAAKEGRAVEVFAKYVKKARLMAETDAKPTWAAKGLKMARMIDGEAVVPVAPVSPVAEEANELLPWEETPFVVLTEPETETEPIVSQMKKGKLPTA